MDILGYMESTWNFVLADTQGNIGYQMSGLMPKRRKGISGFVPLPGWESANNWQGFEKPEDLPRCYNPESGYFVTTNQDLNGFGKVSPINAGMGPYRSDRISSLLAENNGFTFEQMYKVQHDVFSTQAESFMKILGPLLPPTGKAQKLKGWNLEYSADSEEAYILRRVPRELYRLVFGENGFGSEAAGYLDQHTGIFNDFYINFDRILLSKDSAWFGGGRRDAPYFQAAEKALKRPTQRGGKPGNWCSQISFSAVSYRVFSVLTEGRSPSSAAGNPHQGQIFESAGRQKALHHHSGW